MRFALEWGAWNIETPSSGARKPKHGWKPLVGSPRKRGRGSARTPQGKPSPASLSNCACNRLKKATITRTGAYCCWGSRPYKTGTIGYSTKCVEGEFCELRLDGVLRTSQSMCSGVALGLLTLTGIPRRRMMSEYSMSIHSACG